jgi:hypothetical protein
MNKELASKILNLDVNDLSEESINKAYEELNAQYNPEYQPKDISEKISYKPNNEKYKQIVKAKECLIAILSKENVNKLFDSLIAETSIPKVRNQNNNEQDAAYINYIKNYYENIITDLEKRNKDLSLSRVSDLEEQDDIDLTPDFDNDRQEVKADDDLINDVPIDSLKPSIDTKLANEEPKEESDFNIDSFSNLQTQDNTPIDDEEILDEPVPAVETNAPIDNDALDKVISKLLDGANNESIKDKAQRYGAKGIQVTKEFINKIKNSDFKYRLVAGVHKFGSMPKEFFKKVFAKLEPATMKNSNIINNNVNKLTEEEVNILKDEYNKNGLINIDDKVKDVVLSIVDVPEKEEEESIPITNEEDKTEEKVEDNNIEPTIAKDTVITDEIEEDNKVKTNNNTQKLTLEEKLEQAKNSVNFDYVRINKLKEMANALENNEPQKEVYYKLINDLTQNKINEIKDIHDMEEKIAKKENKNNFLGGLFNKFKPQSKDENDSQMETLKNKIKELENKALDAGNSADALEAYMKLEELNNNPVIKNEQGMSL